MMMSSSPTMLSPMMMEMEMEMPSPRPNPKRYPVPGGGVGMVQLLIGTRHGTRIEFLRVRRLDELLSSSTHHHHHTLAADGKRKRRKSIITTTAIAEGGGGIIMKKGRKKESSSSFGNHHHHNHNNKATTKRDEQEEMRRWSALLHASNGFRDGNVRLGYLGMQQSTAGEISKARFMGPSGWEMQQEANYEADPYDDCDDDDEEEEEEEETTMHRLNRHRVHASRRRVPSSGGYLEISLTDGEREFMEDVAYVWVFPLSAASCCWNAHGALASSLPHRPHPFRMENTCGGCVMLTDGPLNLDPFRIAGTDQIVLLGGTLAERLNGREVDFRGVRGIARLLHELTEITRVPRSDMRVTVYMVVMKGCIGAPAMVVDYGTRPPSEKLPGINSKEEAIVQEGFRRCYLAGRMAPWCEGYVQHIDVCQAVELVNIRWAALLHETHNGAVPSSAMQCIAKSSAHVSRRGDVMLRLIFPKDTPWNEENESGVVNDCNLLLVTLRRALRGQPMCAPSSPSSLPLAGGGGNRFFIEPH